MLKKSIFSVAAFIALGIALTGCVKTPKEALGLGMKIDYSVLGGKEIYTVNISGALRNENRSVALKNVNGRLNVLDPDSKKILLSMPFSLEVILPMSIGNLDLEIDKTEEEISPLLDYFGIDRNELAGKGATDGQPLNSSQAVIENITFDKQDIIELLREKI
jgi:hypothetical protein